MKIYLDNAIEINGIKIHHTKEGLVHQIAHYEKMLTMNPVNWVIGKARKDEDTEYMKRLITNWKQHLELYRIQEEDKK
jgi:hypothetical protein